MSKFKRFFYVSNTIFAFVFLNIVGDKREAQSLLFDRLSKLGGLYIKFLQILAARQDNQDLHITRLKDTLSVFDQAPFEYIDVQSVLHAELGNHANSVKLDNLNPIAAGSFGQVYGAHINNLPVVVKVLRPSVVKYLRFDLELLSFIARIISIIQPDGMLDIVSVCKEFRAVTLQEIDYIQEVKNANALQLSLADHPVIHIPHTFEQYSSSNIIVQERVEGIPLTEVLSEVITDKISYVQYALGTDLNYVMEELAVELLSGSLSDSGTHGDPHPGNIYILPNNQIALIDFGIESVVDKRKPELMQLLTQYAALYRGEFNPALFARAMISYFVPNLTHALQSLSGYLGQDDLLEKTLSELGISASKTLEDQSGDVAVSALLSQYRMLNLFTQVINKDNRFGFKAEIEAPAFLRSTQIFLNLVHRLGCDKQLLRRSFERVIEMHSHLEVATGPAYDNESIDRSLHLVAEWFEGLHYSDPSLYNRITNAWDVASI
ncbi:MAG: ubiquinone biosynthesis protein [Patescibacteria group bacterium]|nr:ubiquinone biosynthesis protein [Patescibacteria group bacterium]